MNPPRLDFLAPPGRPAPWSWLLLAAGLALSAWAANDYQAAAAARADAQARLARQIPQPSRPARADAKSQARDAALRDVHARLGLPWNELIVTLQDSLPAAVVLQSLDVDGGRSAFRLEAETRRHADMLAYLEDLQRQPVLREVALIRHEALDADGERVVGFSLSGRWGRP